MGYLGKMGSVHYHCHLFAGRHHVIHIYLTNKSVLDMTYMHNKYTQNKHGRNNHNIHMQQYRSQQISVATSIGRQAHNIHTPNIQTLSAIVTTITVFIYHNQ